uniref:Uncharacterized protein n=1 Tax=Megaselia scalaris TaxID=36166 RepID=T1GE48_MEGSC
MRSKEFITKDFGSDKNVMQQVDMVPTLTTILGVPIPYSNLDGGGGTRCREEQINCADFQAAGNTVFRKGGRGNIYLKSCGNPTGHSINVTFAKSDQSHIDALALGTYALFLIQQIVLMMTPLMVFGLPPS